MSRFGRSFAVNELTDAILKENGWMCDLLRLWRPSGDGLTRRAGADDPVALRLAIRNGYLNFYRQGQSVARVSFDRQGKLQAHIHNKYVYSDEVNEQSYVVLNSAGYPPTRDGPLAPYGGPECLHKWVKNASCYVGEEKRFVDQVVANNLDVIDLEMGLPAFSDERVAPRMDLVALERSTGGWRVVFWEAKLATDGRARCRGDALPEVVRQLSSYTTWLGNGDHRERVAKEYRNACRLLIELHRGAQRFRPDIEDLGAGIREVAGLEAASLLVDVKPRILIDNWQKEIGSVRDATFEKNGHLKKLRDAGIHVQMVQRSDQFALEKRA